MPASTVPCQARAIEVRSVEMRIRKVSPLEVGGFERRPLEVRAGEPGFPKVRAIQVRPLQARVAQIRPFKMRALQPCALQLQRRRPTLGRASRPLNKPGHIRARERGGVERP